MAKSDNSIALGALGFLTGPVGGAVLGYMYANKKQELYAVNPNAERSWDNKWLNAAVGFVGGVTGIPGALFGYNYSKLDVQIEELKDMQANVALREREAMLAHGRAPQRSIDVSGQKWRDYVNQRGDQNELSR
jgi:hypothetical protein